MTRFLHPAPNRFRFFLNQPRRCEVGKGTLRESAWKMSASGIIRLATGFTSRNFSLDFLAFAYLLLRDSKLSNLAHDFPRVVGDNLKQERKIDS
ncbi:MAG: hypothetical protein JWQ49_4687 [Edaphobacter sp.]|nr:hypothetical protein [Edaphobacter sp.]